MLVFELTLKNAIYSLSIHLKIEEGGVVVGFCFLELFKAKMRNTGLIGRCSFI